MSTTSSPEEQHEKVRTVVFATAQAAAEALARELSATVGETGIAVTGPMPCPIARIADRWRMQVEISAPNAAVLGKYLTAARNAGTLRPGETYAVDVDPVALM
jgi:primosomal protein N'